MRTSGVIAVILIFALRCGEPGPKDKHAKVTRAVATATVPTTTSSHAAASTEQKTTAPAQPMTSPCADLERLVGGAESTSALPARLCEVEDPPVAEDLCPKSEEIAVVVDHDDETARRHKWSGLLQGLIAGTRTCRGRDPISGNLPRSCGTIQSFGKGSVALGACRNGTSVFPAGTKGGGFVTPVVQAVQQICSRLRSGSLGVGIIAFDGVPDGDYRDSAPIAAFADAVADCAPGHTISIAAAPIEYRYVYVLAKRSYRRYAEQIATDIAAPWPKSSVLHITPTASARMTIAAARLNREVRSTARWDNTDPVITVLSMGNQTMGSRIDLLRWMLNPEPQGAAFGLQWNNDAIAWQSLAAVGVRQPQPILHVNQELSNEPRIPFTADAEARVARMSDCDPRPQSAATRRSPCGVPSPHIFQSLHVSVDKATLEVFRGADLEWLRNQSGGSDRIAAIRGSRGKPLTAMALVAPALEIDPCLATLRRALRNSHDWKSSEGTAAKLVGSDIARDCASSPLLPLIDQFRQTVHAPFRTVSNTFIVSADRRVGMESTVAALQAVAQARTIDPAASGCVLTTVSLLLESCTPEKRLNLRSASTRP